MPTLLEIQRAMRASVIKRDSSTLLEALADTTKSDRLDIYRNTIFLGLTRTLRLAFPAAERLVGADFFECAANVFISAHLPQAPYLDQYGEAFPDFLRSFPPASSLFYLGDVANLEWAVNCALHACDTRPLELKEVAKIAAENQTDVSFKPHPSISIIRSEYPVDEIWRAVLARDDRALTAVDLAAGPVFLLVERQKDGVEVSRLQEPGWNFLAALCRGERLISAAKSVADLNAAVLLAEHLQAGRFVGIYSCSDSFAIG